MCSSDLDVTEHLDRSPVTETCRAQTVGRDRANDTGECRGVVREQERGVLVVAEAVHASTLPNS